jgi:hypothetical protein
LPCRFGDARVYSPEAIKHNAIHQAQEIASKSQHVKKAVDGHEV